MFKVVLFLLFIWPIASQASGDYRYDFYLFTIDGADKPWEIWLDRDGFDDPAPKYGAGALEGFAAAHFFGIEVRKGERLRKLLTEVGTCNIDFLGKAHAMKCSGNPEQLLSGTTYVGEGYKSSSNGKEPVTALSDVKKLYRTYKKLYGKDDALSLMAAYRCASGCDANRPKLILLLYAGGEN